MKLIESKIDRHHLYFHGRTMGKGGRLERLSPPTPLKPFFVSKDYDYALSYTDYAYRDGDIENPEVYIVTLSPTAEFFDPTNPAELKLLEKLDFWPAETIERFRRNLDVMQIMVHATKFAKDHRDSVNRAIDSVSWRQNRTIFCKQLLDLGYAGYKTREMTDTFDGNDISSDMVYGVIDINGLGSVLPIPIPKEIGPQVNNMVKRNAPIRKISELVYANLD